MGGVFFVPVFIAVMSSSQVILWSTCPDRNSTLNIEVMVISKSATITQANVARRGRRLLPLSGTTCFNTFVGFCVHLQSLLLMWRFWWLAAFVVDKEKDETWCDQHDKEATDLQCKLPLLLQAHRRQWLLHFSQVTRLLHLCIINLCLRLSLLCCHLADRCSLLCSIFNYTDFFIFLFNYIVHIWLSCSLCALIINFRFDFRSIHIVNILV